ncbi:MAG: NAD(P)/FAD-dependent oxidoreductase, partial [Spirochaetales bacterium]|nr:NAD(P)/FAD-dependent oxidoreductase [Spirochaetales bacterium]
LLMKKNRVTVLQGEAVFTSSRTILVDDREYSAVSFIIATGAEPLVPSISGVELPHVLTSREFLELETLPETITVMGGGVIGMEIASLCHSLGVKVTVVEMADSLFGGALPEFAEALKDEMTNCDFHLNTAVEEILEDRVLCRCEGNTIEIPCDVLLLSVGRKPHTESLNLKAAGVVTTKQGIAVNERMQTSAPGVYAIGDVTGLSQYAHAASRMAEVAVSNICGKSSWFEEDKLPWVVYTYPEAAGCGLDVQQAEREGFTPVSARYFFKNTARFFAEQGDTPGWVNLIADRESRQILGVHMLGNGCSELIFGGALLVANELTIDDLIHTVFPHPTVSEALRECGILLKNKM